MVSAHTIQHKRALLAQREILLLFFEAAYFIGLTSRWRKPACNGSLGAAAHRLCDRGHAAWLAHV